MRYKGIIFFLVPFLLHSCNDNEPANDLTLNDTITIQMGQLLTTQPSNFSVKFDSVSQDNRCPLIADCIWEGNAVTKLKINQDNSTSTIYLNTASEMTHDTIVGKFKINLIDLSPYRETFDTIEQAKYSAKIIVTQVYFDL